MIIALSEELFTIDDTEKSDSLINIEEDKGDRDMRQGNKGAL